MCASGASPLLGDLDTIPLRTPHPPVHQSVVGGNASEVPPLPVNKALHPANNETHHTMSAVTAYAPLLTVYPKYGPEVSFRSKPVSAAVSRLRSSSTQEPRGGDYAPLVFTETVETNLRGEHSIMNPSRKGFLRLANPRNSDVYPIEAIRSCVIPMAFTLV